MNDSILDFSRLPIDEQKELQNIFSGKILAPLYSDIVAKRIFHPDVHPDRLNFLLRSIAKEDTIAVQAGAPNEGFRMSVHSKGLLTDIPAWLKDGRAADLEIQKIKQNYIFTRAALYANDLLLLQYSVHAGQAKGEVDYTDVNEVLLVVLMVESPDQLTEYSIECDKYIHRFTKMIADTGFSYTSKAKIIFVQLDKCLAQFRKGVNAEAKDNKPDKLQLWLAMIADINDETVVEKAVYDDDLMNIRNEVSEMMQDKETLFMMLQEKYDRMDRVSYGNEREREGKAEGKAEGIVVGADMLASLMRKLFTLGRVDDAKKASEDAVYREILYKEFHIS